MTTTTTKRRSDVAFANTVAWLDLLYSRASEGDGEVIAVAASRRRLIGDFATDGESLVKCAESLHANHGCYLKINLMDSAAIRRRGRGAVGNRSEVRSIVSFHCDVDAGKAGKYPARSTALWAIGQMPLRPTLVINSNGTTGGFHAYWCLERPHRIEDDRDKVQEISKRWQEVLRSFLGGMLDNTSNIDRVLRCVGVTRKDGGEVCLQEYGGDLYCMEDFERVM